MSVQVSIIVPVYNLERYLERCLGSVLEQDFPGPYEVLVVNDGSTDNSQALIDQFAARHPERLRPFSRSNGGPGAACNYGIERARGDYLIFVEGDDWIGPRVVAEMHAKAVETGADLLIGNIRCHHVHQEESFRPLPHLSGERRIEGEDFGMLLRSQPSPCARLYSRSLFEDPEVRFLEGILYADVGFAPKTYWAARSIYYVDTEWYDYEMKRPDQSIWSTSKRVMDRVPSIVDGLRFYQRKGAFECYRDELEYYAIKLVLSWIPAVGGMRDCPVRQGWRDIFGVLDEFFPGWVDGKPFAELRPSPTSRLQIKISRAAWFVPLFWATRLRRAFPRAYRVGTRAAVEPTWALRKLRERFERAFGLVHEPC